MKCPNCGEEITSMIVNSTCFQSCTLEYDTQTGLWHINDYGTPFVEDTIDMECPECSEKIPNLPDFMDLVGLSPDELIKYRQRQGNLFPEGDEPR